MRARGSPAALRLAELDLVVVAEGRQNPAPAGWRARAHGGARALLARVGAFALGAGFGPVGVGAGAGVVGDFLAEALEQGAEGGHTGDDDAHVDLDDGPLDDGLRFRVGCEGGDGLHADCLDNGNEEAEAVEDCYRGLRVECQCLGLEGVGRGLGLTLLRFPSWSLRKIGKGKTMRHTSQNRLVPPRAKYVGRVLMQLPGILGSHCFAIGVQAKESRKVKMS